jgi:hypothetical protein
MGGSEDVNLLDLDIPSKNSLSGGLLDLKLAEMDTETTR